MADCYRIAVCDNDAAAAELITRSTRDLLAKTGTDAQVSTFTDAESLYTAMLQDGFDLLLLDIDMPGLDGITFSKRLRAEKNEVCIVFVSNYEKLVFDTFAVQPFGFVRKNCFAKDFPPCLEAFIKKMQARQRKSLVFQHGKESVTLAPEDILYIEGRRKQQLIYCKDRAEPLVLTMTMAELETHLEPYGFLRIDHGCLVNFEAIGAFGTDTVRLKNGQTLPVSRRRMQDVRSRYFSLMKEAGNIIF